MKTILHKADTRGHLNHGWLNAHHSFSFANYHDNERTHFGLLRVLNDDVVAAGMGFGMHPHDNMEIVTIPLKGALAHKDSIGREEIIKTGDVQIMSAGSGLMHSEMNPDSEHELNLLQIWIFPKEREITPRYEQKTFDIAERVNQWQIVVSPNKVDGGVWINQDAWFSLTKLDKDQILTYNLHNKNSGAYIFVIEGNVNIAGAFLNKRDAIGVSETENINFTAGADSEILVIEVPMH